MATNIITGTAPLAAAADPYLVRAGGYVALTGFLVAMALVATRGSNEERCLPSRGREVLHGEAGIP